jgi:hypothetical protein
MSSLSSIITGASTAPPRVLLYGPAGVGKSTFGASAPNPIFLQTEDGADVVGAHRFPLAASYDEIENAIGTLAKEKHDYKTVVLDSLDWLEPLIWQRVCATQKVNSIEEIPFAKGYKFAKDFWRSFLDGLNHLRKNKNMAVVMLAHSQVKKFEDPSAEPYDRYQIKLHASGADVCMEASDLIGFASYRTSTKQIDGGFGRKLTRAVGTGERVLRTAERPAFVAKSRYAIPDELPLSWDALISEIYKKEEAA